MHSLPYFTPHRSENWPTYIDNCYLSKSIFTRCCVFCEFAQTCAQCRVTAIASKVLPPLVLTAFLLAATRHLAKATDGRKVCLGSVWSYSPSWESLGGRTLGQLVTLHPQLGSHRGEHRCSAHSLLFTQSVTPDHRTRLSTARVCLPTSIVCDPRPQDGAVHSWGVSSHLHQPNWQIPCKQAQICWFWILPSCQWTLTITFSSLLCLSIAPTPKLL